MCDNASSFYWGVVCRMTEKPQKEYGIITTMAFVRLLLLLQLLLSTKNLTSRELKARRELVAFVWPKKCFVFESICNA